MVIPIARKQTNMRGVVIFQLNLVAFGVLSQNQLKLSCTTSGSVRKERSAGVPKGTGGKRSDCSLSQKKVTAVTA